MLQNIEELGIEKGIKEGIKEGIKKGRKEGREEGRDEVLLNIMKSGMVNIDQMVKLTGVGADYIKNIASKFNISLPYQLA